MVNIVEVDDEIDVCETTVIMTAYMNDVNRFLEAINYLRETPSPKQIPVNEGGDKARLVCIAEHLERVGIEFHGVNKIHCPVERDDRVEWFRDIHHLLMDHSKDSYDLHWYITDLDCHRSPNIKHLNKWVQNHLNKNRR